MTYHMELTRGHQRNQIIDLFDKNVKFPEKLYDVLEEGSVLMHWRNDGEALLTDSDRFEAEVGRRHPGLVQIETFANFRRQLRW